MDIAPKGSKLLPDFLAEVMLKSVADKSAFENLTSNAVNDLKNALNTFDLSSKSYDEAFSTFITYMEELPLEIDLGDGIKINFVKISSGTFERFDISNDNDDLSTQTITLTKPFYMSKYEITQAQYKKITGVNPSNSYFLADNKPVENVSWYDAIRFCNSLSINQGLNPCYTNENGSTTISDDDKVSCNWSANGYRLPTEAEWEYCCRAGTTGNYSCPDNLLSDYAWYYDNNVGGLGSDTYGPKIVGTKLANPWGLYDMHGNVEEWCWDYYDAYSNTQLIDPVGPTSSSYTGGDEHVCRGGTYGSFASILRSGYRNFKSAKSYYSSLSFRIVSIR